VAKFSASELLAAVDARQNVQIVRDRLLEFLRRPREPSEYKMEMVYLLKIIQRADSDIDVVLGRARV